MVSVELDLNESTNVTHATYGKLLVRTLKVAGDVRESCWEECYRIVVRRRSVAPVRNGLKVHMLCGS